MAQEGAHASLGDPDFIAGVVRSVEVVRRDYDHLASDLGLKTLPSATNFVAVDLGSAERATTAMKCLLEEETIFVRMPGVPPLNRCIRVTVGTPQERADFADAFRKVVAGLQWARAPCPSTRACGARSGRGRLGSAFKLTSP